MRAGNPAKMQVLDVLDGCHGFLWWLNGILWDFVHGLPPKNSEDVHVSLDPYHDMLLSKTVMLRYYGNMIICHCV